MASSSSSSIPPQQTSNPDTITNNPNSNSNSTSRSASASASASIHIPRSHHPHHHELSTSTPVVAAADGSATSTQGHTQPHSHHSNSNSHEQHFYQHQHHSRSHSVTIPHGGMPGSAPPPSSTSPMGQMPSPGSMGVPSIPGSSYYYHPYTLFPPPPPPPPHSHSHHGPPPPHPPAPPAPPRANRTNSSQLQESVLQPQRASIEASPSPFLAYASTPSSVSIQDERINGPAGRPRGPSTSASPSLRGASPSSLSISTSTPVLQPSSVLSSSSSSSHVSSRPQLHPTFSYYRSQANYDKQHGLFQRGVNQIHPSDNVVADTMSDQLRAGRSPSVFSGSATNDNDQQDIDNDIGVEDYDGDMSAVAMHTHPAMDLPIDPSILPSANSNIPTTAPSSSSLNNNYMLPGSEKRPNHEYYPSPHHQVQFRELMVANNSTHLPDPPISLNSLVDSEPGKKPAYPLPTIIRCAILGSPHERLTLSELYLAMEHRFSYYTLGDGKSWRNSVRHNLSLNNLFEKVARPITEPGKGCYWVVAHDKPPGNKRERKRNKKPGKKALAAMEREKEAAAAASAEAQPHSVTLGSGRQTDDEDEGDDAGEDEDDIDDSRIDQDQTITLNSSTVARRRYIPSGSSTSATTTSNVAAFSPYMTTTMTTMRPPFGNAYSRGTVAPNEGSYAAVTGVIPLLSQIPLPPASFGIGMASSASSVRYGANPSSNPNEGPFSAYAPQNESGGSPGFNRNNALMGFGNTRVQTGTDMNIGSASSMWSHATSNRTSTGESATGVATASSKRKRRTTAAQNNESLTAVREQHPGTGTMSQHASAIIQNQESGSSLSPSMIRNPSQESGASTKSSSSTFTQATPMQSSSSSSSQPHSSRGRIMVSASTTPFTGSASPSPAALGRASLTLGPAQAQPLSAQSSFGSVGFSIPESVATTSSAGSGGETSASTTSHPVNTQRGTYNRGLGPQRTTRQNPTRRFDPVVPSSITNSSTTGLQPFNSTQNNTNNNNNNRPRDTFNALAAQIASEFPQTRTTSTSSDLPINFGGSVDSITGSTAVNTRTTRKRPQLSRTHPVNGLRSSKKQPQRGGESQSEGSEEEEGDEGSEEDEDEDEDEYVPSGSARRRGRRR